MTTARTRNTKVIRVHRGSLTGQGRTITEAKTDLESNVTDALTGSYDPAIVTHGAYSAMVYRTPDGWNYRLFGPDRPITPGGVNDVSATCMMGNATRDEAIQNAASHVIGLGTDDYRTDADIPAFLTDPDKRQHILFLGRFQRAYRWARDNRPDGRDSDMLWHEWACHHDRDPQFA